MLAQLIIILLFSLLATLFLIFPFVELVSIDGRCYWFLTISGMSGVAALIVHVVIVILDERDNLQTIVKKWFRDKDSGFLENGTGPDILVRKADLVNCQFLKVGTTVEFECHPGKQGLVAKKVKLLRYTKLNGQRNGSRRSQEFRPGVMT